MKTYAPYALMVSLFFFVSAYRPALADSTHSFSLSVSPRYPSSYQTVAVSAQSTDIDLAASTLKARVNGVVVYEGGVRPFNVALGAPGKETEISATLTTGGDVHTASITLAPADVALVIEPRATTPALYRGKPSVPLSGNVRIVAVTDFRDSNGVRIPPSDLIFSWTVEDTFLQANSGAGRDVLTVPAPFQYRTRPVSLVVKSKEGRFIGGASVTLSGNEPLIRIYENDPLLGVRFERSLRGTFSLNDAEISLFAAPYSFSLTGGMPSRKWFLNNRAADEGGVLTLRPEGNGAGKASVSVRTAGVESIENAAASLLLTFHSGTGGLFGL